MIMAVPCCHNHLHRQVSELDPTSLLSPFSPMLSQVLLLPASCTVFQKTRLVFNVQRHECCNEPALP